MYEELVAAKRLCGIDNLQNIDIGARDSRFALWETKFGVSDLSRAIGGPPAPLGRGGGSPPIPRCERSISILFDNTCHRLTESCGKYHKIRVIRDMPSQSFSITRGKWISWLVHNLFSVSCFALVGASDPHDNLDIPTIFGKSKISQIIVNRRWEKLWQIKGRSWSWIVQTFNHEPNEFSSILSRQFLASYYFMTTSNGNNVLHIVCHESHKCFLTRNHGYRLSKIIGCWNCHEEL